MVKIIKDPIELTAEGVSQFAAAFRADSYEIITSQPTPENIPQRLSATLSDVSKIRMIMEDPDAGQCFFSIAYQDVIVPIGVYGVSPKKKARFPLVINGIWITLISLNQGVLSKLLGLEGEEDCAYYFSKYAEWKKGFIRKAFTYYFNAEYCSAMSWEARGKESSTRVIAEEIGFYVYEFDKTAIYSKLDLSKDPGMLTYFKNCLFRWKVLSRNDPNPPPDINANIVQLLRDTVGLEERALLSSKML